MKFFLINLLVIILHPCTRGISHDGKIKYVIGIDIVKVLKVVSNGYIAPNIDGKHVYLESTWPYIPLVMVLRYFYQTFMIYHITYLIELCYISHWSLLKLRCSFYRPVTGKIRTIMITLILNCIFFFFWVVGESCGIDLLIGSLHIMQCPKFQTSLLFLIQR